MAPVPEKILTWLYSVLHVMYPLQHIHFPELSLMIA
jgi:hypothetical protein